MGFFQLAGYLQLVGNLKLKRNLQFKLPQSCGALALSTIAPLLMLSACTEEPSVLMEPDQNGGLNTRFSPPEMLTQSRTIEQSSLRLSIVVNNREYLVPIETGTDSGSLTIPIARGEELDIVITWSELYNGQLLTLAQAKDNATVPVNGEATFNITVNTDNYSTDFDDDGDQISNLDERNNDTDPRGVDLLADPIVQVPIRLIADIPERLDDVSDDVDTTLSAVATVDRATASLNREGGDTWTGEVNKPANSDVLINYSFYSSNSQNVVLASWEGRRNAGESGTTVDIASSEYDYEIDDDGDGKNNLQEIIAGTNPEDRNDPLPNPCDISDFEVGCNNDTDGDGTPDSVETEARDQDDDSIPDYLESKNDDADDDGFNAELDSDETDPCIPSEESAACDDSDPTDPPVIGPPEESPLSYQFFLGQFGSMPDFNRLTPALSDTATTFSLPPNNGESFYALQFTGKLFIAEAGEYTFYTASDDGSLLFIDGQLVVDNDGTHAVQEASGVIALSAGLHDIVLEYFQNGGIEALTVSWSSPTIDKQVIPETVLFEP